MNSSVLLDEPTPVEVAEDRVEVRSLGWSLWAARALLFGQLIWLLAFSTIQYGRGGLTLDFSIWEQARWLIAHGHLNPYSSVASMPFWQLNANWLMWPLAEFSRLPPHGLWLLWLQDLAIFGCGWVAVNWIYGAVRPESRLRHQLSFEWKSALPPQAAVLLIAALLVANPWVYTTASFDFHWEAPGAFFMMLTAWDLVRGRHRRMWIWAALACLTSDVSALYVAGVGLGGLLTFRKSLRKSSIGVLVAGLLWTIFMAGIHANRGSFLTQAYAYLAGPHAVNPGLSSIVRGAVFHPSRPVSEVWGNRLNVWANLSPSGLIGVLTPWGFGAVVMILAPSLLWPNHLMAAPSFQNFPVYPIVAVGSVLLLGRLGARSRRMALVAPPAGIAMVAFGIGWAWNWLPSYPPQWLSVTPSGSAALQEARQLIPPGAEVVASNGIAGRFADRRHYYLAMNFPLYVPVQGSPVYFVLSNVQGVLYAGQDTEGLLTGLAQMGATEVMNKSGVYVFKLIPKPGTRVLTFEGAAGGIGGWLLHSTVGSAVTSGPSLGWRMEDSGHQGLVVWGDYWSLGTGTYDARVELAVKGQATIQVFNPSTNTVFASDTVKNDGGGQVVTVPFVAPPPPASSTDGSVNAGPAPFDFTVAAAGPVSTVEIRVAADVPATNVSVYSVAVGPSS